MNIREKIKDIIKKIKDLERRNAMLNGQIRDLENQNQNLRNKVKLWQAQYNENEKFINDNSNKIYGA